METAAAALLEFIPPSHRAEGLDRRPDLTGTFFSIFHRPAVVGARRRRGIEPKRDDARVSTLSLRFYRRS